MRHFLSSLAAVLLIATLVVFGCSDSSDAEKARREKNRQDEAQRATKEVEYRTGDKVVVIGKKVPLKAGGRELHEVGPGFVLTVRAVQAERLSVAYQGTAWIDAKHVIPLSKATDYFTDALHGDPKNTTWRYARALVWLEIGELNSAIADCTELIRLRPDVG